jgi:hypothetical protein
MVIRVRDRGIRSVTGPTQEVERLSGKFNSRSRCMTEAKRIELRGQIGLVVQNAFLGVALRPTPVECVGQHGSGVGHGRVPVHMAEAERITQVEHVVEAVIQSRCADIDPGFFFISGQTVKIAAIRSQRRAVNIGKAIIRDIVFMLHQVTDRHLRRSA